MLELYMLIPFGHGRVTARAAISLVLEWTMYDSVLAVGIFINAGRLFPVGCVLGLFDDSQAIWDSLADHLC